MRCRSLCGGALALVSLAGCRSDRAMPAVAVAAPAAPEHAAASSPTVVSFTSLIFSPRPAVECTLQSSTSRSRK